MSQCTHPPPSGLESLCLFSGGGCTPSTLITEAPGKLNPGNEDILYTYIFTPVPLSLDFISEEFESVVNYTDLQTSALPWRCLNYLVLNKIT